MLKLTAGNIIGGAFDAADVTSTFKDSRQKGRGLLASGARAMGRQALWIFAPSMMWTKTGIEIGKAAIQAGQAYGTGPGQVYAQKQERQYGHNLGSGTYVDTQVNATMRQRGKAAIQQSGQNLNSVFGGEARTYFRGSY